MTVASILEYEASATRTTRRSRGSSTTGWTRTSPLQLDSTVSYVSKRKGDVWTTPEERDDPSEYNTYQHIGLPPGPIGSPGEKTIEAALNPAEGDWLYFVAVNLETARRVFNRNLRRPRARPSRKLQRVLPRARTLLSG